MRSSRVAVLVGCVVAAPHLRQKPTAAATERFAVPFEQATVSFHDRTRRHQDDPPREQLDDTPCRATGTPWVDAEDATLDAFVRSRDIARALAPLRGGDPMRVVREPGPDWPDANTAISRRRVRHEAVLDVSIRVTHAAGYLVLWGRAGVQVFCFSIEGTNRDIVLRPRIVSTTDF